VTQDSHPEFRTPLVIALITYKAVFGLGELVVGVLLLIPDINIAKTFRALTAGELREDPTDRWVALMSRHLPSLIQHRTLVAVGLLILGVLKLVAAGAMWEGHEWGRYLLLAVVAAALPLDVRQAIIHPSPGEIVLLILNVLVVIILATILRPHDRGTSPA
jgi:uncharacterized membrane protein (DUF2068 family)